MTTLHISTKVMPILVFATKPHQHFIRTEVMPTFIFIMKPRQHSTLALTLALKLHQYLHWNHANIHLHHEATSTLHSHQSRANIYEATSKLHLHRSRTNIHEAMPILYCTKAMPTFMKPRQNFICTEVMPTFIFVMKSRQHFILALKSCWHPSLPWSYVNASFTPKLCQHSWSHVKTSFVPKPCQHSWSYVKTSFAQKSCQHSSLS